MTYKHITVSLPPVPMGQQFDEPFKQTEETEEEYAMALAAPAMFRALDKIVRLLVEQPDGYVYLIEAEARTARRLVVHKNIFKQK